MAINVSSVGIGIDPVSNPNPVLDPCCVDPVYSGGTSGTSGVQYVDPTVTMVGVGTVIDYGTSGTSGTSGVHGTTVINPGDVIIDIPPVRYVIDPCQPILVGLRPLVNRGASGSTAEIQFADGVSGFINFPYGSVITSGQTQINQYSIPVESPTGGTAFLSAASPLDIPFSPGKNWTFIDYKGELSQGSPRLLPDSRDIASGATVYINGIDIYNNDYRPFTTPYGTYVLTYLGDSNNKYFFSLTGDLSDPNVNNIKLTQNTWISGTITYGQDNKYYSFIYASSYYQYKPFVKENRFNVDAVIKSSFNPQSEKYYQNGVEFSTDWDTLSSGVTMSDYYLICLPDDAMLTPADANKKFIFNVKQAVFDDDQHLLLIYSNYYPVIDANIKTSNSGGEYFLPISTAETVEITFTGYEFLVTNAYRQNYNTIGEKYNTISTGYIQMQPRLLMDQPL